MSRLNPDKLHVSLKGNVRKDGPLHPRRYTLTHSDLTGDLFLTIAQEYDRAQINGWYTRLMRDEVLAEWQWKEEDGSMALHVFCHVSGGLVLGSAGWRYRIFQQHMRQVLEAFCEGDKALVAAQPELADAKIVVHFKARENRYNKSENWGVFGDYRLAEMISA